MKHQILLKFLPIIFSIVTTAAYASPTLWIDDARGNIGTVDVATGNATVIGSAGVALTDIAFNSSGNLYGVSFNELYSINEATGHATAVGSLGVSDVNGLVFSASGTLYASSLSGELYSVNTSTGTATGIFNTGFSSGGDLAFNGGKLYYTDGSRLISINLVSNTASLIGTIGSSPFYGLATADNGKLYGVANQNVFDINTVTGAGTLVSTYSNGLSQAYGTAFFTEAGATQVPEPTSPSLFLIGIAIMIGAYRKQFNR